MEIDTLVDIEEQGSYIEGGIVIQSSKNGLVFFYEESELQLQVWYKRANKGGKCVLSAELCIPDCYDRSGEDFVGLLGTPDGNQLNDWTGKDGTEHPVQAGTHAKEYNYCVNNW